jgi:hypothetical protein
VEKDTIGVVLLQDAFNAHLDFIVVIPLNTLVNLEKLVPYQIHSIAHYAKMDSMLIQVGLCVCNVILAFIVKMVCNFNVYLVFLVV